MAWRQPGNKPLSEPLMVSLLTHICVTRPQWEAWQPSADRVTSSWGNGPPPADARPLPETILSCCPLIIRNTCQRYWNQNIIINFKIVHLKMSSRSVNIGHFVQAWIYSIIWSKGSPRCTTGIHYNDVIMGAIASQTTSLTIVYSTVYSDTDKRKHQSSAPLAFVRGIHRGPVNSPHKWQVTQKMFPFDDVIMFSKKPRMWSRFPSVGEQGLSQWGKVSRV